MRGGMGTHHQSGYQLKKFYSISLQMSERVNNVGVWQLLDRWYASVDGSFTCIQEKVTLPDLLSHYPQLGIFGLLKFFFPKKT